MSACFVRNQMYVASKSSCCTEIVELKFEGNDMVAVENIKSGEAKGEIVPFSEKFCSPVFA